MRIPPEVTISLVAMTLAWIGASGHSAPSWFEWSSASASQSTAPSSAAQTLAAGLEESVAQLGATTPGRLVVSSPRTVTSSLTVRSNISLVAFNTGVIAVAQGAVLTIDGPFEAGRHRVFTGPGRVVFGPNSITQVSPHWFEATTDVGADNSVAIDRAVNALSQGGEVLFEAGTYRYRTTVTLPSLIRLVGRGLDTTTLLYEGTNHAIAVPGTASNQRVKIAIEHLGIHGNPKSLDGLAASYAPYGRFRNVRWYGFRNGVSIDHSWGTTFEHNIADFNRQDGFLLSSESNNVTLIACSGNNNGRAGLVLNGARGSATYAGNFEANAKYGVYVLADVGKPVSGIDLRAGYLEGNEIDVLIGSADGKTIPKGITIDSNYFLPLTAGRTAIRVDWGDGVFVTHNTFDEARMRYDYSLHVPSGSQMVHWGTNQDSSLKGVRRDSKPAFFEMAANRLRR